MSATTAEPPPASNLDLQPGDILLHLIVTLLAPMFLGVCCGNLDFARMAALETVNAYRARSHVDLIAVAQIVAHGLASVSSACLSMSDEISLSMTLRLRASANASDRACDRNRRALEKNRAAPVPDPVFAADSIFAPEPEPGPTPDPEADRKHAEEIARLAAIRQQNAALQARAAADRPAAPPPTASTPAAQTQAAHTAAAQNPVATTPVATTPVATTQVAQTPVAQTPVALTPVAQTPAAPTPSPQTPVAATPTAAPQAAQTPVAAIPTTATQPAQTPVAATPIAATQPVATLSVAPQHRTTQAAATRAAATSHRPPVPARTEADLSAQDFQQLWGAAMTVVANEYEASLADLPPAERDAARARAAVLNRAAGDLYSGNVPPRLRAGDLGSATPPTR
ncbi:hypothetical protein [Rhodopila sp.]|uniref:hypothetical protein n=1 Tax=Rhodopila sp. TaxID=2480087 RepID=UPI003D0A98EC